MPALFWAMTFGSGTRTRSFSACADLDGLFGNGWSVISTRGVKSSTVEVLATRPMKMRLHQTGNARPDAAGLDPNADDVARSIFMNASATLVDLFWTVSFRCFFTRSG